ncbi:hypothetical protein JVT61DRAFT_14386 [Boletus reticuloceps]|uniref:Uncharacterized protein n=1 Tax=Boletus reticuloceps TaxID=495285 RepID=A0A8I2YSG9_9AGAM|nr:hypothetical protein JVT61DRAFT_14386 [Boletus reticuloceps]
MGSIAWLKDKKTAKFMIPTLYHPHSLVPQYIWKASPSTTNENEQAHQNIHWDGTSLTLLLVSCGDSNTICA